MIYQTSELLTAIKKRGFLPSSQQTFTDDDILRFANEDLQGNILPWVIKYNQGYYATTVPITLIDGTKGYKIPDRAAFRKLKDVYLTDTSTGEPLGLAHILQTDIEHFTGSDNKPQGYYLESDKIQLVPTTLNASNYTLQSVIYFRPNKLVQESRVRTVTATTSNTITINTDPAPSHFTTDVKYDVIDAESGNTTLLYDLTCTNITNDVLTFSDTITGIKVGDEVVIAGETSYPQIPEEMTTILIEWILLRLFQAHGDQQGVNNCLNRINIMQGDVANIIEDRVTGQKVKLVNRTSLTRINGFRGNRVARD